MVAKAKMAAKNETIQKMKGYNEAFEAECKKSQEQTNKNPARTDSKMQGWNHQLMNEKASIAGELAQLTAENVNLKEHIHLLTEQSPTVALTSGGAVVLKKQEKDHDHDSDSLQ